MDVREHEHNNNAIIFIYESLKLLFPDESITANHRAASEATLQTTEEELPALLLRSEHLRPRRDILQLPSNSSLVHDSNAPTQGDHNVVYLVN